MEMDDDNDGEPPAPGTEEDGSGRPPLPPGTASVKVYNNKPPSLISLLLCFFQNTRAQHPLTFLYFFLTKQIVESSGTLVKGQKRKASQMNKAITIGSSPILYTQPVASAGKTRSLHNICS